MPAYLPLALVLWVVAVSASASTVAPPAHLGELGRHSTSVAFAECVESSVEAPAGTPFTLTRFRRLRMVGGEPLPKAFTVRQVGGTVGEKGVHIAGSPRFEPGRRYLLFLDPAPRQGWTLRTLSYGVLVEDTASRTLQPLPEVREIALLPRGTFEPTGVYRRDALLDHLQEVIRGARWDRKKVQIGLFAPAPDSTVSALGTDTSECRFLGEDTGNPIRWFGFTDGSNSTTVTPTTPGQTGITDGGEAAVDDGAAAWRNFESASIRFSATPTAAWSGDCTDSSAVTPGEVVFDDPCGEISDLSNCSGTLAFGGTFFSGTGTHAGMTWDRAISPFVVVNNKSQCIGETSFKEMMTHELGHSLGFGHHTDGVATMSAFLKGDGRGAALRDTDRTCAVFSYPTFFDVSLSHPFWAFIEAIENAGVTSGCGGGNFCPGDPVTREAMAVFLLISQEGSGFSPPPCTTPTFSDVPCSDPFAPWIEELVARGITAGCGGAKYCPESAVTREQMAVFLLATLEGSAFTPPACTTPTFSDVPCSSPFADWIEELVDRGITAGCGSGQYCPKTPNNRGQMAVFLTSTFSLPTP